MGQFKTFVTTDDCCLHETPSCNKDFELTHFMYGLNQLCLICGTLSTFAVGKIGRSRNKLVIKLPQKFSPDFTIHF